MDQIFNLKFLTLFNLEKINLASLLFFLSVDIRVFEPKKSSVIKIN